MSTVEAWSLARPSRVQLQDELEWGPTGGASNCNGMQSRARGRSTSDDWRLGAGAGRDWRSPSLLPLGG